jgi:hypothetical protein
MAQDQHLRVPSSQRVTIDLSETRRLIFFLPPVAVCIAWVRNAEAEHAAHLEHLAAENDGHIPQPPPYPYLNLRAKPFPWGMNSLFFNPHVSVSGFAHPLTILKRFPDQQGSHSRRTIDRYIYSNNRRIKYC